MGYLQQIVQDSRGHRSSQIRSAISPPPAVGSESSFLGEETDSPLEEVPWSMPAKSQSSTPVVSPSGSPFSELSAVSQERLPPTTKAPLVDSARASTQGADSFDPVQPTHDTSITPSVAQHTAPPNLTEGFESDSPSTVEPKSTSKTPVKAPVKTATDPLASQFAEENPETPLTHPSMASPDGQSLSRVERQLLSHSAANSRKQSFPKQSPHQAVPGKKSEGPSIFETPPSVPTPEFASVQQSPSRQASQQSMDPSSTNHRPAQFRSAVAQPMNLPPRVPSQTNVSHQDSLRTNSMQMNWESEVPGLPHAQFNPETSEQTTTRRESGFMETAANPAFHETGLASKIASLEERLEALHRANLARKAEMLTSNQGTETQTSTARSEPRVSIGQVDVVVTHPEPPSAPPAKSRKETSVRSESSIRYLRRL